MLQTAWFGGFFDDIIQLRNRIVGREFSMAREAFDHYLDGFTTQNINTEGLNSDFWNRYVKPKIDDVTQPLHRLSKLEHDYVCTMLTFVIWEEIMLNTGA